MKVLMKVVSLGKSQGVVGANRDLSGWIGIQKTKRFERRRAGGVENPPPPLDPLIRPRRRVFHDPALDPEGMHRCCRVIWFCSQTRMKIIRDSIQTLLVGLFNKFVDLNLSEILLGKILR